MRTLVTSAKTASPEGIVGPWARLRALVGAGILALAGLVGMAAPAAAGPLVDPDTLQPPPPPAPSAGSTERGSSARPRSSSPRQ